MELLEFIEKVKQCKYSMYNTGEFDVSVSRSSDNKVWHISGMPTGKHWKKYETIEKLSITMKLKKGKDNLTIFEAGMLFLVCPENKKPSDYAGWHNSIAGKEFIENIESINSGNEHEYLKKIQWHQKEIMKLIIKLKEMKV